MISYDTGITQPPPVTPAMRQAALAGLAASRSANYSMPFSDVYEGRAQQNAIDLEREAVSANNTHLANVQQAQMQYALQGAGQMATGQQNQAALDARRRSTALEYAQGMGDLLAGLYS
jgi:hypothetical protein